MNSSVWKRFIGRNLLLISTILSVFIGLFLGFLLRPLHLSETTCLLINFPGEIFMQVLKMTILPLIFSSLISALAQLDWKESGKMGLAALTYYLITAFFATIIGITLVILINPGSNTSEQFDKLHGSADDADINAADIFLDLVRNMFPANILQASFQRVQTKYVAMKKNQRWVNATSNVQNIQMTKEIVSVNGTNILGIIVFCTAFGMVTSKLGTKALIIVEFFVLLDAVIMRWVQLLMWFAPVGIFCLICGNMLELGDLTDIFHLLFMYTVTVISGLVIHTLIVMPGLYVLVTKKNPIYVAQQMLQALVTAFGTASSGAALPISMHCLETKLHVDRRVTRFVLPLGTTINMDGNALYEAVAIIFIAQLNKSTLSLAETITVSITATIASVGLGSVPAGLVSILLILNTVGLPAKDVPLLLTIDWLLDRIRTMINVLGDGYVAGAVEHLLKDKLNKTRETNQILEATKEEIELLKSQPRSRNNSVFSWTSTHKRSNSKSYFSHNRKMSWKLSLEENKNLDCKQKFPRIISI